MLYAWRMITPQDAATLAVHTGDVADAADALEVAKSRRDAFVRKLLRGGAGPTEVGRLAGLSRERIYQIRDGRR